MNVYQWAIQLKDMMSPALQRAQATYGRFGAGWQQMTQRLPSGLNMARQSVDQLRSRLDGLTRRRSLAVDTSQLRGATRQAGLLERALGRLRGAGGAGDGDGGGGLTGMVGGLLPGLMGEGGGGIMGMAKKLLPVMGVAALAAGVGSFAKSGMDREQTKVGFEQFVGKDGVNPMMKQLNRFADVTPYSNEDVYKSGRSLLSAHVDPNHLTEKMTNIGNLSAVAQKDFGEMSQTYAKIKQKGFIDGGELHQEFGGTALMSQLKKNLKVGGDDLFKMAEQRKIKFADVDKAIADLSAKGGLYEGGLDKLSKTAGGKLSTLMGTFQNKVTELAEKLNPMLGKLFDFGSALLAGIDPVLDAIGSAFSKLWDAAQPLRDLFSHLWDTLSRLFDGIGGGSIILTAFNIIMDGLSVIVWIAAKAIQLVGDLILWLADGPLGIALLAVAGITAAWWLFNAALAANPIGVVVVAIAAMVGGIKYAWEHVDGFRHAIMYLWEVAKSVFGSLGKAWDALMKGDFSGIADALGKGWTDGLAKARAAVDADNKARAKTGPAKAGKEGPHKFDFHEEEEYGSKGKDGKGGKKKSTKDASGVDGAVNGAKSTNITINLKSLVEHLTINANGVTDGMANMEEQVKDTLLRVLNSANSVAS